MKKTKNIEFWWQKPPPRRIVKLFYSHKYHCWVYCRQKMTFQQLSKKYPLGVVPPWKKNLVKLLAKGSYHSDPYFSDVLSKITSFVLRG